MSRFEASEKVLVDHVSGVFEWSGELVSLVRSWSALDTRTLVLPGQPV